MNSINTIINSLDTLGKRYIERKVHTQTTLQLYMHMETSNGKRGKYHRYIKHFKVHIGKKHIGNHSFKMVVSHRKYKEVNKNDVWKCNIVLIEYKIISGINFFTWAVHPLQKITI